MPFIQLVFPEEQLVRVQTVDHVDAQMCAKAIEDLANDPEFRPTYKILADLRQLEFSPSTSELQTLVALLCELGDIYLGPIALVVEGPFYMGLGKMVSATARLSGLSMAAFDEAAAAEQWLEEQHGRT
jgi:hypothetical protein